MNLSIFKADDELGRQCSVDSFKIIDTPEEEEFEEIVGIVKEVFHVPIVAISIIDRDRQWFKSIQGLDAKETTRDVAFCDHTINSSDCFRVPDARKDPPFNKNPLVTGEPYIQSYLGAPLITQDGYALGALCLIDTEPRTYTKEQEILLTRFSRIVMRQISLREFATIDYLTGIANQRDFKLSMLASVRNGSPCLVLMDIDNFKSINDTYGHEVGDIVLKAFASVIDVISDGNGKPFRIGGEEFAVILPGFNIGESIEFAEKLRKAVSELMLDDIEKKTITASFGVSKYISNEPGDEWFKRADRALYASKQEGRNRTTVAVDG